MSLLQEGDMKHAQPMTKATAKVPVTSGQNDEFGALKCGPIPDCGLLYDTLSLEWGGYKDQVDELKKLMADNAAAWDQMRVTSMLRVHPSQRRRPSVESAGGSRPP